MKKLPSTAQSGASKPKKSSREVSRYTFIYVSHKRLRMFFVQGCPSINMDIFSTKYARSILYATSAHLILGSVDYSTWDTFSKNTLSKLIFVIYIIQLYILFYRYGNTSWEKITSQTLETLDSVSKNTSILESNTILPSVSMVWISTLCWDDLVILHFYIFLSWLIVHIIIFNVSFLHCDIVLWMCYIISLCNFRSSYLARWITQNEIHKFLFQVFFFVILILLLILNYLSF